MQRLVLALLLVLAAAVPASARVLPYPRSFAAKTIATNGTQLFVRVGGHGPAVVLLHGFGDSGDMWQPLAVKLVAAGHTVIVPDLRGMGLSAHPDTGYTKKNEAVDIAGVMDALHVEKAQLVTHDIGNMVGYALAAQYPQRITKWVVIDAPLPGVGGWAAQLSNPKTWHFNFYGPDEERLVAGRERIYLDRFYNELSDDPRRIDEQTRAHYTALYARPHAIHDAFEQFKAFLIDAHDNPAMLAKGGKLTMPVLALGGEKSYGAHMKDKLDAVASNVTGGVIPNSGHWIMEENPDATVKLVMDFLTK
jgi:pimeloyl-ACP methyl ester carboxylesterase